MIKYGKIINEETGLCEVGLGTNEKFYKSIGMNQLNVQQSDIDGLWYTLEKCQMKSQEVIEKEEQDKINKLTMTALDLVTYIRKVGATTEEIVNYLNTNPEVYLQLTLCQNVYCGVVRQLAPIKVNDELTITDEQIITIFKDKNQL